MVSGGQGNTQGYDILEGRFFRPGLAVQGVQGKTLGVAGQDLHCAQGRRVVIGFGFGPISILGRGNKADSNTGAGIRHA